MKCIIHQMSETVSFGPIIRQETRERESQVRIILIRGLEDLPESVSRAIGKVFNIETFDAKWRTGEDEEDLERKLGRLDAKVTEVREEGKYPIVLGVSAGAAMMEAYMLRYPDKVLHGYSLSGLLINSTSDMEDLTRFIRTSPGFGLVANYLKEKLTPEAINNLRLPLKISAYNSPKDTVVLENQSHPSWIKSFHDVKKGNHVQAIVRALATDIVGQMSALSRARFD